MTENTEVTTDENGVADYSEMHWKTLQSLMTAEGQEWVDKKHAVAYLTNLDADDGQELPDDESSEDESPDDEAEIEELALEGAPDSEEDPEEKDDEVTTSDDLVTDPVDELCPVFDPSKDHGEVYGSSVVRYRQNFKYFDSQGNYVPDDKVDG